MFLRVSYVSGDSSRLDDLITYARTVVKPATDVLPGNLGLAMWANRESGDAVVATVWNDEETLRASEDAVVKLRDDAAGIVGGNAIVERYETVFLDGSTPHQIGNVMRLVRMHCDPAMLDDHMLWAQHEVVPRARTLDGYLGYAIAADRADGAILSSSTYRDMACATAAGEAMALIRDAATARGIIIDSMADYEVAIVGIRAPMPMAMPAQRTVDLTEAMQAIDT
jgi:hypothetical protein